MDIAELSQEIANRRTQLEKEISDWQKQVFNLAQQTKFHKRRKAISLAFNGLNFKRQNNGSTSKL